MSNRLRTIISGFLASTLIVTSLPFAALSEEIPEPAVEAQIEISTDVHTEDDTYTPANDSTVEDIDTPADDSTVEDIDTPADDSTVEDIDTPANDSTVEDTDTPTDDSTVEDTDTPADDSTVEDTDTPTDDSTVEDTDTPADDSIVEDTVPSTEEIEASDSSQELTDEQQATLDTLPEGFSSEIVAFAMMRSSGCSHTSLYVWDKVDYDSYSYTSLNDEKHLVTYKIMQRELSCNDCGETLQTIDVNKTVSTERSHGWGNWDTGADNILKCYDCNATRTVDRPCSHTSLNMGEDGNLHCQDCDADVILNTTQTYCKHTNYTVYYPEVAHTYYSQWDADQHLKTTSISIYEDTSWGIDATCNDCGILIVCDVNGDIDYYGNTDRVSGESDDTSALEAHTFDNGVCKQCGYEEVTCKHEETDTVENTDKRTSVAERVDSDKHKIVTTQYFDLYCKSCKEYAGEGEKVVTSREELHAFNAQNVCTVCGYGETCTHSSAEYSHYTTGGTFTRYEWTGNGDTHYVILYDVLAECYYCYGCGKVYIPAEGDSGAVNDQDFVSSDFALRERSRYIEDCYMTNGWTHDYYSCNYCENVWDKPSKPTVTITYPSANAVVAPNEDVKITWTGTLLGYEGEDNLTDYEYVFCHVFVTEEGKYFSQGTKLTIYSGKQECIIPAGTLQSGKNYTIYITYGNQSSYYDMIGAQITIRTEEIPCDHSAGNYEDVLDESIAPVYSNITETTHCVQYSYKRCCKDCGEYIKNVVNEGLIPAAHDFSNGDTCACGYVKVEEACDHSAGNYEDVLDDSIAPVYSNIHEDTHCVQHSYKRYCKDCGEYIKNVTDEGITPIPHDFSNGNTCACGYERKVAYSISFTSPVNGGSVVAGKNLSVSWSPVEGIDHYEFAARYIDETAQCVPRFSVGKIANASVTNVKYNKTLQLWVGAFVKAGDKDPVCTATIQVKTTTCDHRSNANDWTFIKSFKRYDKVDGNYHVIKEIAVFDIDCSTCGEAIQNHELVNYVHPKEEHDWEVKKGKNWRKHPNHEVVMTCKDCKETITTNTGKALECCECMNEHFWLKSGDSTYKCSWCGTKIGSAIGIQTYKEYQTILREYDDPLKSPRTLEIIREELIASKVPTAQIEKIVTMIQNAPDLYQKIYLYSFFDYGRLGVYECDVSFYSRRDWSIHMDEDIDLNQFATTWFHESGHAIDNRSAVDGGYRSLANDYELWKKILYPEVSGWIDETIRVIADNSIDNNSIERIKGAILNPDTGATVVLPVRFGFIFYWTIAPDYLSKEEKAIYKKVVGTMSAAMTEAAGLDSDMVSDVIGGVTNNTLWGTTGHTTEYYWYNEDGIETGAQCQEAWAEFFAMQMTQDKKALEYNYEYLPNTCAYFEQMAEEILAYYQAMY